MTVLLRPTSAAMAHYEMPRSCSSTILCLCHQVMIMLLAENDNESTILRRCLTFYQLMNSLFSVYWLFAINCLLKNWFCLTSSSFWSTTWNLLKIQRFKMWILAVFPTGLKILIQSVYIHLGWGHHSCGQGWAGWGTQSQFLWNRLVSLKYRLKKWQNQYPRGGKEKIIFL